LISLAKIMDAKPYGLKVELARTLAIFFLAEFVARSGYYQQTYWERRGTLVVADTFFVSSVFLGWNIYKLGSNWSHIVPVAKANGEKAKTN
jgi:alkylglycerol monooxygenase